MKKALRSTLLLFLLSASFSHAQLGEFRFECTTGDSVRALAATAAPNGGLYVLGSVANGLSNPTGNANDAVVVRIGSDNTQQWAREYDPGTFQSITDIATTADGGFVMSGTSTTVYFDGFVGKGNPDGTLEWSAFPGNPDLLERGYAALPTSNGGYLFAGHHSPQAQTALYLVKYDAAGTVEWGQYYPINGQEGTGWDVAEVPAGGYLVTGYTGALLEPSAFVVRLNEQGEQLWANTYTYEGRPSLGLQVVPLLDGTFALLQATGLSDAPADAGEGAIISRINLDGTLVWSRLAELDQELVTVEFNGINFSFSGQAEDLVATPDGNLLFAGGSDIDDSGDIRPALAKLSTDGELLWGLELAEEGFLSGPFRVGSSPLAVTSEGYYAYVFEDLYDRDGFRMVKVDADGQGVCADAIPDDFFAPVTLDIAPVSFEGISLTASSELEVTLSDEDFSSSPTSSSFTTDLGNDTLLCAGASLLLDPELDSTATYLWQDGSTDSTFTVNQAGVYSVTVTQDECTAVDSIAVVTPEEAVALGPDQETCGADALTIGPAFQVAGTYEWSNGAAEPSITVDEEGAYTLSLSTVCGTVTDEIAVSFLELPDLNPASTSPSCNEDNGAVSINPTGGDPSTGIQWLDAGGELLAEDVLALENLPAGTYEVALSVGPDCTVANTFTLEALGVPSAEVTVSPPNCQGEASGRLTLAVMGGAAPYTFNWSRNGVPLAEDTAVLNGLSPGLYAYTLTDANGCFFSQDSIALPDVPPINFTLDTTDPACPGEATGTIAFSGLSGSTAPYTFSLNGGPAQQETTFGGLEAGAYEVLIENNNNCDTSITVALAEPSAVSLELLARPNPADFGDSVQLEVITSPMIDPALSTLQWAVDSGVVLSCNDCLSPSLLATTSTDIALSLTLEGGCTYTQSLFLQVNNDRRIFIPNAFSPNEDGRNDQFELYIGPGLDEIVNFKVFNRWGGLVFEGDGRAAAWDGDFLGEPAPAGVYAYVIQAIWADGLMTTYEGEIHLIR